MRPTLVSILVLLIGLGYSVVRYVALGPVNVDQIPAYISNKALSLAGLILIAMSLSARMLSQRIGGLRFLREDRKSLGMIGLGMTGVHALLSLMLLNRTYFTKFYDTASGLMTWQAELSMLAGAAGMAMLIWQSQINGSQTPGTGWGASSRRRRIGLVVLALTFIHVAAMGYAGWLVPGTWHGSLPPITLLSAIIAGLAIIVVAIPRKDDKP